jgi:hypothetical protein
MYGGVWQLLRLFRPAPLAKSDVVRAFPLAVAIVVGALIASAVAALDLETRPTLIARATSRI